MDKLKSGTIIIQYQDGTSVNLSDKGFLVKSFTPPSPNFQYTWQQMGKYKALLTNSEIQQSTFSFEVYVDGKDFYDFELIRLELKKILTSDKPFYVIWTMMPYLRYLCVPDMSNLVMAQDDAVPRMASPLSISLISIDGFAESTATTQTPFTYDSESWGLGENLPNGVDIPYTFTTPSFNVYNASNIPLRAEEHPFTLKFQGTVPSALTIENVTTGQTFILNRSLTSSDTMELVGLVPIVNGSQDYGDSNHAYLDLAEGWNEFEISGASNFTISFDTHFYY